ncbi:MAG TPA: metallophosphoesterase [Syntrophomonadaceae bacterium]|nr:metallophosphoesterase [Syntrophomonadaceae bacterium]
MTNFQHKNFKVALVGDTHGNTLKIRKVLKPLQIDHILFTGDLYSDAKVLSARINASFDGVLGNCDNPNQDAQEEKVIEIADKRIYLTHGHRYNVKKDLSSLYYRAKEINADIVVYGHTHMPKSENIEGILFINPGSPSQPRGGANASFAILEWSEGKFTHYLVQVD